MEECKYDSIIDFANKYIHIGEIIPSVTQEELLFSLYPECFISLIFAKVLGDLDAFVITNVIRCCEYSGYRYTFECTGEYSQWKTQTPRNIVAIDAVHLLSKESGEAITYLVRDINKAYVGFKPTENNEGAIITGLWGCGIFNHYHSLKFIQQVIAASMHKRKLIFSVLDQSILSELNEINEIIADKTISDVYNTLVKASKKSLHARECVEYFLDQIKS